MKAWYFESHMSFYKLSLEIYYKKNSTLSYITKNLNLKKWSFKLLFSLNKKHNTKKPLFKLHKIYWSSKSFQKILFGINVITSYYHWVFYSLKALSKGAWSPYSLIMHCYKFLGTLLKVHYVMAIQKLFMKFIQCDIYHYYILCLFAKGKTKNRKGLRSKNNLPYLQCDTHRTLWFTNHR